MTVVKTSNELRKSDAFLQLDLGVPSTPANSFITDVAESFAPDYGNWFATATWVSLLDALGIASASARTALHRMEKGGYLERETRDDRRGYAVTAAWQSVFEQVGDASNAAGPPAAKWALMIFSIPERQRADRHALRTVLTRSAFASLGNGVWVAPSDRAAMVRSWVEANGFGKYVDAFEAEYEGFASLPEFAARCWDIEMIAVTYRVFIRDVRARFKREPLPDQRTFVEFVRTKNAWRRIDSADPQLPALALPEDWPRAEAAEVTMDLLARWSGPAREYVRTVATRGGRTAHPKRSP